jgi:2-C-methyl-D-erythritol 2,4-cyclodiphosphate synthase
MGVRFSADVRRLIVAATTLAEARQAPRPRVRDLTDALANQRATIPPIPVDALNDDLEDVLGPASELAGNDEVTLGMLLKALGGLARTRRARASAPRGGGATPLVASSTPSSSAIVAIPVRVGVGYDSHRYAQGGPLRLGGIDIPGDVHAVAHSDGDAVCHALTDAILGAANAGDIGELFPDTDAANAGRDSIEMLRIAVSRVHAHGYVVANADITVIAERPRIGAHRDAMRRVLADALGVGESAVSLKGKTNEGMDAIGRGEGLAAIAVATIAHTSR